MKARSGALSGRTLFTPRGPSEALGRRSAQEDCYATKKRRGCAGAVRGPLLGQVHEQQRKDHQGKRSDLKNLSRYGRPKTLKLNPHELQQGEQVSAQSRSHRVPATEYDDGEGNPSCSLRPLGSAPPRFGAQGERGPCQAHEKTPGNRVYVYSIWILRVGIPLA